MKKKKKSVYATGGKVGSYIENPSVELQKDSINKANAAYQAESNPLNMGLDAIGKLMQAGAGYMGANEGDKVSPDQVNSGASLLEGFSKMFAMGGVTPGSQIEAEGEEVVETPDGKVQELKGPKHESGGIDLFLPEGTEIFSDRLTGENGKTMAERKKIREKKASKISKLFESSPSDTVLKKTMEKVLSNNELEEQKDLAEMEEARALYNMGSQLMMGGIIQKFALGGVVDFTDPPKKGDPDYGQPDEEVPDNKYGYMDDFDFTAKAELHHKNYLMDNKSTPSTTSETVEGEEEGFLDGFTMGDGIGMAGTLMSTLGPYLNTQRSRATDTPNVNSYKNFGQDALAKMDESKANLKQQEANALKDVELTSNAARKRGRNSARGVNTQRAMDLATTMQQNLAQTGVYGKFSEMLQGILSQEAQLENQQDSMVMQGEAQRDLADRQDKDNYFSNLAEDISTMGTGTQKMGKDVNAIKSRKVTGQIVKDMFPNFQIDAMTGKTKFITEATGPNHANYLKIESEATRKEAVELVSKGKAKWEEGVLVDKNGNELNLQTLKQKNNG